MNLKKYAPKAGKLLGSAYSEIWSNSLLYNFSFSEFLTLKKNIFSISPVLLKTGRAKSNTSEISIQSKEHKMCHLTASIRALNP